MFLLFMLREQKILSCLFLALASYKGLYPIMLLAPLCVVLLEKMSNKTAFKIITRVVIPCSVLLGSFLAGLLWISYIVMDKNWNFLWSTYGFILSVPGTVNRKCYVILFSKLSSVLELTPNMGLFWYIFTEMFEHFRVFFVATFQLNVFVYVIPLSIRLRKDPFLLVNYNFSPLQK